MKTYDTLTLSADNTIEENARIWAEHQQETTEPGHGFFSRLPSQYFEVGFR